MPNYGDGSGVEKAVFLCNNIASVIVLNSRHSHDHFSQKCLREVCLLAARFEFLIRAVHIAGIDNPVSDALSRWLLKASHQAAFDALTSDWNDRKEVSVDSKVM